MRIVDVKKLSSYSISLMYNKTTQNETMLFEDLLYYKNSFSDFLSQLNMIDTSKFILFRYIKVINKLLLPCKHSVLI